MGGIEDDAVDEPFATVDEDDSCVGGLVGEYGGFDEDGLGGTVLVRRPGDGIVGGITLNGRLDGLEGSAVEAEVNSRWNGGCGVRSVE